MGLSGRRGAFTAACGAAGPDPGVPADGVRGPAPGAAGRRPAWMGAAPGPGSHALHAACHAPGPGGAVPAGGRVPPPGGRGGRIPGAGEVAGAVIVVGIVAAAGAAALVAVTERAEVATAPGVEVHRFRAVSLSGRCLQVDLTLSVPDAASPVTLGGDVSESRLWSEGAGVDHDPPAGAACGGGYRCAGEAAAGGGVRISCSGMLEAARDVRAGGTVAVTVTASAAGGGGGPDAVEAVRVR